PFLLQQRLRLRCGGVAEDDAGRGRLLGAVLCGRARHVRLPGWWCSVRRLGPSHRPRLRVATPPPCSSWYARPGAPDPAACGWISPEVWHTPRPGPTPRAPPPPRDRTPA